MNTIKKLLGILWMVLAPAAVYFMFSQASVKISEAAEGVAKTNTALQWGIILFIFIPVSAGLFVFGLYSMQGEYDHLPENSNEI